MGFSINRVLSLGFFLVCLTGLGSALHVFTEPQPFTFLTKELNISCVADEPAYSAKSILGMQIMRHIEDKPIASIDMRQVKKMAVGIRDNVKAEGHIGIKSNTSFLTLIIDKPNKQDAGPYRCQMFFIDEDFQIVEKNVIANATYQELLAQGWTYYKGDDTYIKVFGKDDGNERLSWSEARGSCQALGGDLVQIRDEDKNNFVLKMFEGARYKYTWIGVKNHASHGFNFKYVDGTDLGSYHPWYSTDLNGSRDNDYKCVIMYTDQTDPGEWYDWPCSNTYPYVCST